MQDLVIGAITGLNWKQIRPWVQSLDDCGYTGMKAMVVYNCHSSTVDRLIERDYKVISFQRTRNGDYLYDKKFGKQIVVLRFFHMWKALCELASPMRYVITTDVKDVVYQTDPAKWLEKHLGDKQVNVGSEGLQYRHEPWGDLNMRTSFGPTIHEFMSSRPIYNCGTIAGSFETMKGLFLSIFLISQHNPFLRDVSGYPDQAALNILLSQEPYRSMTKFNDHDDTWACQAGTTVDPRKMAAFRPHLLSPEPAFVNGVAQNSAGEPYCILHQYDRIAEMKSVVEARYSEG